MFRQRSIFGLLVAAVLGGAAICAADGNAPALEETLAWLKKLPTMSRSAIGPPGW